MFVLRWVIGRIILFFDFIFSPSSPKRSQQEQAIIDAKIQHISLYQLPACPFCVKVRRAMKREGVNLEIRNISGKSAFRDELINGGGQAMVPCLRIAHDDGQVQWMYESSDIIDFLKAKVAA